LLAHACVRVLIPANNAVTTAAALLAGSRMARYSNPLPLRQTRPPPNPHAPILATKIPGKPQ
jgi:hypothetical protein